MKERKTPLRKCISCHEMSGKRTLYRIVRTPEGEVLLDMAGKKPGRGAYVCGKSDCFQKVRKNKGLDRALNVSVQPEIYEQLAQQLAKVNHES